MEKNLNLRISLKILEFLIESKESSIRNMAKSMKEDYKSVYQTIKRLEKIGLILIKKVGKSNLCSLIKKPHPLIVLTEFKRRDKLLKDRNLKVVYNRLKKINRQFIILLFGSIVKGKYTKHSDIDFLVVSDKEVFKVIEKELSLIPLPIHLTHLTYEEFMQHLKTKEKTVVSEALKKNIVLFGIEDFYRLLENAG